MFAAMAAAHVSPRKRRSAVLATVLSDLDGNLALILDCLAPGCGGQRRVLIRDLAGVYGRHQTVAEVLRRMRCAGCGGRPGAAWLTAAAAGVVGRARAARLALIGPDATRD